MSLLEELRAPGMEVEETHISWIFLAESEVFKVKKPVSFGFLDFTTAERRRAACEAEIRLNRRLAPTIYRGCVPVTRGEDGRLRFGGEGPAVDWAVHMERLAREERADSLLAAGRLEEADLVRIAERLAVFHQQASADEETARWGGLEVVRGNVNENFAQTQDLIGSYLTPEQVEELEGWQLDFLERHADRFEQRRHNRRIREGHGDLRLEHVYLRGGEVVVVDCIEFNRRFRDADVCADVAFLAMDLAWHGRLDLAERFLAAYARAANDFDLYLLVDFYESYRALVRAKIAAMVAADPGVTASVREQSQRQARRYFLLALASERRPLEAPGLVAFGGWIASGKSTVADGLAAALAAPVVDADRTRKHLMGVAPTRSVHEPAWKGAYAPERSRQVYSELLRRADVVLSSGRSVVVDASFRSRRDRLEIRELARRHSVPFQFVECRADAEECRRRLRRRQTETGVSDGRLEIFDDFVARWQRVEELGAGEHLVLDATRPLDENLGVVRRRLGR